MQYSLLGDDPLYENDVDLSDDLDRIDQNLIYETIVFGTDWTTETIVNQVRKGNIVLDPKFQRRDAWTRQRKSLFIESVFMGLPIPQIVLAESKDTRGRYLVIDGKQRLLSLMQFCGGDGFDELKLNGMEILLDFNNKTFDKIKSDFKFSSMVSSFENQPIRTVVIKNWRDEGLLYRIFLRLNTGSVGLSPQELRQALHPGPFVEFADMYSMNSESLRRIYNNKKPDFRMRDVELFIRYYAFRLFIDQYSGNLKKILDDTCCFLNKDWDVISDRVESLADDFELGCQYVFNIFGDNAFKKWIGNGFEKKFNKAIFDFLMYYFSDEAVRNAFVGKESAVIDAYVLLFSNNEEFVQSVERTTKSLDSTFLRISEWGKCLQKIDETGSVVIPRFHEGRIRK